MKIRKKIKKINKNILLSKKSSMKYIVWLITLGILKNTMKLVDLDIVISL